MISQNAMTWIWALLASFMEKAMAPHSSTLAWKIPWMEEPGGLQSMGSLEWDTTERLHFRFSLSCIGEGNGNPLQCSCLENPSNGGVGGLPSKGSHRVGHDWGDLAAAAASFMTIALWPWVNCIISVPLSSKLQIRIPYILVFSWVMKRVNTC